MQPNTDFRRNRFATLASLGLILALLFVLPAQPGPPTAAAAPASADAATAAIPAAELLNPDGTLNTSTGASGAVNLAGWQVTLDAERGPVLTRPAAPTAPAAATWSPLDTGTSAWVRTLAMDGSGNLYVGGDFDGAGDCTDAMGCSRIAKWDGSAFSPLGAGVDGVGEVYAIAFDSSGNLYAGGGFQVIGTCAWGMGCNRIAKWDGSTWSPLGTGVDSTVYAIAFDGSGNLYAGGLFYNASTCTSGCRGIAKWNGSTWSPLGTGVGGGVYALVFRSGNLYAGGSFGSVAGCTSGCSYIASWDGSAWSPLGTGMNDTVMAIAFDGSGNLHAGGFFTGAGSCASGDGCNRVAKWNGSTWSPLGAGMNNRVRALAFDGSGNLYANGNFTSAGSCTSGDGCNYIAQWDGGAWSPLGTGLNSWADALAFGNGNLYAGGAFTSAGGVAAQYIAKWGESAPAVCTATASGDWSIPATWSCGHVPGAGEKVVIPAGFTVTLDADITLDSDLEAQGTLVPNGKTVTLTGNQPQTLKGSPPNMTFYNLVVNKTNATDTVTIDGKLKVTKKLTITKGKLKSASDYEDIEIGPAGTLELTSDITVGGNWTNNGAFTHGNHTVTFDGTTLQTLDGANATLFYRWVIAASAQVAVATVPTAADSVENSGVLSQTQTVNNATVNFLQISTDKYRGVDIDATGENLGAVTVAISGNHATCTSDAGSPPYRNRCFRVNVGTAPTVSATMTFYTTATEDDIATGDALYLYFFGTWADQTATCGAGAGDSCSKTIENLQAGDNYFLIGGADSPTAVTLSSFRAAAPQFDLAAWLADLLRRLGVAR